MNTQVFTRTTKIFTKLVLLVAILGSFQAHADWKVDFSRRARSVRENDLQAAASSTQPLETPINEGDRVERGPASVRASDEGGGSDGQSQGSGKGLFDTIFDTGEPIQEIVILNTEKGFVPSTVRVRKNGRYKIHVVNINEKEKNVSFILDGFSEHHATYYGKLKTFMLEPKKEGVYSFQSPETSAQGRLTVLNPQISVRTPSSENAP